MIFIRFTDIFRLLADYATGFTALLVFSAVSYGITELLKTAIKTDSWHRYIPAIIFGFWTILSVFWLGITNALIYGLAVMLLAINFNEVIKFVANIINSIFGRK